METSCHTNRHISNKYIVSPFQHLDDQLIILWFYRQVAELNARANLPLFDKVSINTKVALLSWLIRKRNNISQAELANILNVSISTIKRVEEGITTSPTVDYLRGLKQLDPKIDLNIVFERVTEISA